MLSWSLAHYIPPTTPYGDGRGCYFVLYTRGTGDQVVYFWMEVKVWTAKAHSQTESCMYVLW